jgi:parallel beta-helix repeat protein
MSNRVFYVACNGDDRWSGLLDDPNETRTDGPFATLLRARDAIREMKLNQSETVMEPVTVKARGGKYYLDRIFQLTAADSGTASAPVTYCAYPGEVPVISGGRRVDGWKRYKDDIFRAEIAETRSGLFFRNLYADGIRQVRARYPKKDPDSDIWGGRWATSRMDAAAGESSYCEPYIIWDEPDAFQKTWSKPAQGELFICPKYFYWGDSCLIRIKAVDPARGMIRLAHGVRNYDINPMFLDTKSKIHPEYCQFVIENLLEELTEPGEWCLDAEDGFVYYRPAKGTVDGLEIVIPVLKSLIHLEGASNIRIAGFTLTETLGGEPNSHYWDVEGQGAQMYQMGWEYIGDTIYMNRCDDCQIEDNRIFNVGGNGIYLRNHNERHLIRRNEISYTGGHGLVMAGGQYNIYSDKLLSDIGATFGRPHPAFNEVSDNEIHHTGIVDTYSAGIFLGLSNWNRIVQNEIHDVPRHAINLGNSRYGRNYVEYNHISRAALAGNDTAAINVWHEIPRDAEVCGHVIRWNLIHDIGNPRKEHGLAQRDLSFGIYLDNWTSDCLIFGNIIIGVTVGIMLKGKNNIIENNIFVNSGACGIWISAHASYKEHATVVERNIFYEAANADDPTDVRSIFWLPKRQPINRTLIHCDGNLYYRQGAQNPVIAISEPGEFLEDGEMAALPPNGVRWTEWSEIVGRQGITYDQNSQVGDPHFTNSDNRIYDLSVDSPALKQGFQPIRAALIGRRSQ